MGMGPRALEFPLKCSCVFKYGSQLFLFVTVFHIPLKLYGTDAHCEAQGRSQAGCRSLLVAWVVISATRVQLEPCAVGVEHADRQRAAVVIEACSKLKGLKRALLRRTGPER